MILFLCVFWVPILTGKNKIEIPRTRKILQIFEPIIFPRDKSGTFWAIDEIVTENSGREVPKAISVDPIIRGDILIDAASLSVSFTR